MTADGPAPVLVLTAPRSCSTVVTAMLGAHPEVVALPETKLFRRPTVAAMLAEWPAAATITRQTFRAGLVRAVAQVELGSQGDDALAGAVAWLEQRGEWSGARVLDHLRSRVAPRLLLEKSPETSARVLPLERIFEVPDVRLIHLVRHPATTAESFVRMWEPPASWHVGPDQRLQFAAALWLQHHRRVERATASLPARRLVRVRAEDVVNRPAQTLPHLCAWLGIDAGAGSIAAMMRPDRWEFASNGSEAAPGGGDPHFLAAPELHPVAEPASVDLPASWRIDPWTRLSVAQLARAYGY
jgi:hypothetical protein